MDLGFRVDDVFTAGVQLRTRDRCHVCFNRGMADRLGVAFDNTPLQPIVIADADCVPHAFQIRSMLVATGHELAGLEITNDDRGVFNGQRPLSL